jgi:hypothetical protein
MKAFFDKHGKHFGDKEAVKLIKIKAEEAYEDCKKYPDEPEHYQEHLAELWDMLEDYFEVKGIKPESLL